MSTRTTCIRYRTKPEHAEANAQLIRDVFRELEQHAPAGMRYTSMRAEDGVTFMHSIELDPGGSDILPELAAFARFRAGIAERCAEPPTFTTFETVGSYGWTR